MTPATASIIPEEVAALCRAVGLDISYIGWHGEPVSATLDAILALLRALGPGMGFELPGDSAVSRAALQAAAADVERSKWYGGPLVEVAWGGRGALDMPVRASVDGDWEIELRCESGRRETARGRLFPLPASSHHELDGEVWCKRSIELPLHGELGVHEVVWEVRGQRGHTTVIAAPERCADRVAGRTWGVFAPLYGLRSPRSGATGDMDTMHALRRWVHDRGGAYVGALPILAQFLAESINISPYAPASRLFWNELYLALRPPAMLGERERQELLAAAGTAAAERARLATLPQVAYGEQYRWKRAWIDQVAERCVANPAVRASIEQWAAGVPAFDYAMFRAFGEMEGRGWHTWAQNRDQLPMATSAEEAAAHGADPSRVWSHVVAQWMMHQQLVAERADEAHSAGLYLDLPVGVSGDAYEVWRHRKLFVTGASAGAPPDALFLGGQEWGLPPVHPRVSQATGHHYLRACLRHHMQAASMLRIDHVMGLHRLYCVPRGFGATEGAYLRYPKEELYALIALESRRYRCAVVGEDLGTVPPDVPPALARHNVARLWVSQFEIPSEVGKVPRSSPPAVVASFGTHDMATFSGWWQGADLADRRALGLINDEEQARQLAERRQQCAALLAYTQAEALAPADLPEQERAMVGATIDLARSPAEVVLVTLEDLWLEGQPQNVPGTYRERDNWLRPLAYSSEQLGIEPDADGQPASEPQAAARMTLLEEVARVRSSSKRE